MPITGHYCFALFLNDLCDELGGGVILISSAIRVFMYADDVVVLLDGVSVLQK